MAIKSRNLPSSITLVLTGVNIKAFYKVITIHTWIAKVFTLSFSIVLSIGKGEKEQQPCRGITIWGVIEKRDQGQLMVKGSSNQMLP